MADQGRSDFYVVFTIVNKFAISNHTALILGVHALRSYLKLIYEYEPHSLLNKKISGAKDHGKTTSRSNPGLPSLRNRLILNKCVAFFGTPGR